MGLIKTGKLWSHDGTIEVTAFGGDHFVFIRNPDGQPLLRMAAVSLDDGKTVSKPATIAIADNIVTRLNIGEKELQKGEVHELK